MKDVVSYQVDGGMVFTRSVLEVTHNRAWNQAHIEIETNDPDAADVWLGADDVRRLAEVLSEIAGRLEQAA